LLKIWYPVIENRYEPGTRYFTVMPDSEFLKH
jgi:hypothetical protein